MMPDCFVATGNKSEHWKAAWVWGALTVERKPGILEPEHAVSADRAVKLGTANAARLIAEDQPDTLPPGVRRPYGVSSRSNRKACR
jgi:hypothetical protein